MAAVFDDDESRTHDSDDAKHGEPEPGLWSVYSTPISGRRQILTRKPSADQIDRRNVVHLRDVLEPDRIRPVLRENRPRIRVDLALPDGAAATGTFESEFETADAGE